MSLWRRLKYCWEKGTLSAFWDCMEDEASPDEHGLDNAVNELRTNVEEATQATERAKANRVQEKQANKEFRHTLRDVLTRLENEQTR